MQSRFSFIYIVYERKKSQIFVRKLSDVARLRPRRTVQARWRRFFADLPPSWARRGEIQLVSRGCCCPVVVIQLSLPSAVYNQRTRKLSPLPSKAFTGSEIFFYGFPPRVGGGRQNTLNAYAGSEVGALLDKTHWAPGSLVLRWLRSQFWNAVSQKTRKLDDYCVYLGE